MPVKVVDALVLKINDLTQKYSETFTDIEKEITDTEKKLCTFLDELRGNDFDMKGISEFKSLLMGQ